MICYLFDENSIEDMVDNVSHVFAYTAVPTHFILDKHGALFEAEIVKMRRIVKGQFHVLKLLTLQ
jgi:hypothetical protein